MGTCSEGRVDVGSVSGGGQVVRRVGRLALKCSRSDDQSTDCATTRGQRLMLIGEAWVWTVEPLRS